MSLDRVRRRSPRRRRERTKADIKVYSIAMQSQLGACALQASGQDQGFDLNDENKYHRQCEDALSRMVSKSVQRDALCVSH